MSILSKKYFHDERAAFRHLECLLWPDGPICPHCGSVSSAGHLKGVKDKKGRERLGLWKCYAKECRMQFTVRVKTAFESAHIPLHKMLHGITYKSAWFLTRRIREVMRDGKFAPMGGAGGIIASDATQGRLAVPQYGSNACAAWRPHSQFDVDGRYDARHAGSDHSG
jgi:hypothetical protein